MLEEQQGPRSQDFRIAELEFLAYLDRAGPMVQIEPHDHLKVRMSVGAFKDLVLALIFDGAVTGLEPSLYGTLWPRGVPEDPRGHLWAANRETLPWVLENKYPYYLRLTHFGRLRLARLREELNKGRMLDQTGILLDGRNVERDLRVQMSLTLPEHGVSVVMADLDHFKQVNDILGHAAGDQAIRQYFTVLRDLVGGVGGDCYRRGGDETLSILTGLSESRVIDIAEAIRAGVATELADVDLGESAPRVTLSLGVLHVRAPREPSALLGAVDKLLYRSKRAGRNRVSSGTDEDILPADGTRAP